MMMFLFKEQKSKSVILAIVVAVGGAVLLSLGDVGGRHAGNHVLGFVCAAISVFSYAGYIVGVRKSRAVDMPSVPLTCYVMGLGAVFFIIGGWLTGGVRVETNPHIWLYIAGLSLVATAISNISLVQGIKLAGPTLTSILGAMEPLTAVVIGVIAFGEAFTAYTAVGIVLIIAAVLIVIFKNVKQDRVV